MAHSDCYNGLKAYYEQMLEDAKRKADSQYRTEIYKDTDGIYHKIDITPCPIEKLRNFCSDKNISVEGNYQNGKYVVTFSKFGYPYTATFDSYMDYIRMGLDMVNTIIEKLTAWNAGLKLWANAFYGMSSGGRPFENAVVKYSKEDVKSTMETYQSWTNYESMKENIDFNRIRNKKLGIEKVIFNNPATVVLWKDGTKTVVKCQDGDNFDKEKGLAMAICKKALGTNASHSNFNDILKKWITED